VVFYSTPDTFQTIWFFTGGFFRFLMRTFKGFFVVRDSSRFFHFAFEALSCKSRYRPISTSQSAMINTIWCELVTTMVWSCFTLESKIEMEAPDDESNGLKKSGVV